MVNRSLLVDGMSCEGCVATVTDELGKLSGVEAVRVDLTPGGTSTLHLTTDREIDDATVQAALANGGDFTIHTA